MVFPPLYPELWRLEPVWAAWLWSAVVARFYGSPERTSCKGELWCLPDSPLLPSDLTINAENVRNSGGPSKILRRLLHIPRVNPPDWCTCEALRRFFSGHAKRSHFQAFYLRFIPLLNQLGILVTFIFPLDSSFLWPVSNPS